MEGQTQQQEAARPIVLNREPFTVCRSANELAPHRAAWEDLSRTALEENVFLEPWMLLPALHTLCSGLLIVLVWAEVAEGGVPLLIGLFPFTNAGKFHSLSLQNLSSIVHLHCYLGTPLIRAGYVQQSLAGFFSWWERAPEGRGILEFRHIDREGAFSKELLEYTRSSKRSVSDMCSYSRAFLDLRNVPKDYLDTGIKRKVRKELHRKQKRFMESGELVTQILKDPADLSQWLEDFLKLESAGWKGANGSALGCSPAQRSFFETISREGLVRGRLLFLRLLLNGKVIAMKHSLIGAAGGVSFFKIAHDEQNAKFSPGMLLEYDNLKTILERNDCAWVDSCTDPKNIMCNQLLSEKRSMHHLAVAGRTLLSKSVVRWLPLARDLYRHCRGLLRAYAA